MATLEELYNGVSNFSYYYGKFNKPEVNFRYTSNEDPFIRGGFINSSIASTEDSIRLTKFLTSVSGLLFILKEQGLQFSNPRPEVLYGSKENISNSSLSKISSNNSLLDRFMDVAKQGANDVYNFVKSAYSGREPGNNYRIFNPASIIANAGGIAYGKHYVRFGTKVSSDSSYSYEKVSKENNTLQGNKIKPAGQNPNRLVDYLIKLNTKDDNVVLDSYKGGPDSLYGIGNTEIKTYYKTLNKNYFDYVMKENKVITSGSYINMNSIVENKLETYYGFRNGNNSDAINSLPIISDKDFYENYNNSVNNNSTKVKKYFDNINVSGVFGKDIVNFRIEVLDNDSETFKTEVIALRAFLKNLSDSYNAGYQEYRYIGRGESFYVYNSFKRTVNTSLSIVCFSRKELKIIYNKLNYLASVTAPDYSSYNKMRGNISYITIGDYIYRQPVVITNVSVSIPSESWDINNDSKEYALPMRVDVTLGFNIIHTFLPKRNYIYNNSRAGETPATFITPDSYYYSYGRSSDGNNKYIKPFGKL